MNGLVEVSMIPILVLLGLLGVVFALRAARLVNELTVYRRLHQDDRKRGSAALLAKKTFRMPSPTGGLLRMAERRLPEQLAATEKERWSQEMRADVASLPRRKRLRVAFNAWRKGAPGIPIGSEGATQSLRD